MRAPFGRYSLGLAASFAHFALHPPGEPCSPEPRLASLAETPGPHRSRTAIAAACGRTATVQHRRSPLADHDKLREIPQIVGGLLVDGRDRIERRERVVGPFVGEFVGRLWREVGDLHE